MNKYQRYLIIVYPRNSRTPKHYYVHCRHQPKWYDESELERYFGGKVEIKSADGNW